MKRNATHLRDAKQRTQIARVHTEQIRRASEELQNKARRQGHERVKRQQASWPACRWRGAKTTVKKTNTTGSNGNKRRGLC